ncbi:MAG: hypothetical protein KAY32_16415, partial [Candidatus Eisenbacteria sp.]|nr:hypothetical protein [Candidatus Eisenbacteria bacterium]
IQSTQQGPVGHFCHGLLADDPDLRATKNAVYQWLQGRAPRPSRAMALVRLSGGRLTLESIYQHSREVRQSHERGKSFAEEKALKALNATVKGRGL